MQDKPYALFGTCLGAIVAYEIARTIEKKLSAPMPVALFAAAVSPPHLYALAVMKLYMTTPIRANEPPPFDEIMQKLLAWDKLPKATIMQARNLRLAFKVLQRMDSIRIHTLQKNLSMLPITVASKLVRAQVFEKGNFAGIEAMKTNDRLYQRVAPMGVNDIIMAVQYKHVSQPPLAVPIIVFDGLEDATIERGNMDQWAKYTTNTYRCVPINGNHYFVSTMYRQVTWHN